MDYLDILTHRRSVREFSEEKVSEDKLKRLLLAANNAPVGSSCYKDIHLTIVEDRSVLDELSRAAQKRYRDRKLMSRISTEPEDRNSGLKEYDPFYGAPLVIFVSHRKQDLQPGIEFANVAIAAYSMQVEATELGLGSVFMWFSLESMRELPELDNSSALGLPEGFEPLIGIAVGHAAKEPTARDLKNDRIACSRL